MCVCCLNVGPEPGVTCALTREDELGEDKTKACPVFVHFLNKVRPSKYCSNAGVMTNTFFGNFLYLTRLRSAISHRLLLEIVSMLL